jgi:alpha-tubulin suppressor-like RCC1 family protein
VAYCWGSNADGQLGNGTLVSSPLPVLVQGGLQFAQIDAGGTHTCGLLTTGEAYCWGRNSSGQLGVPTTTPACTVTGAICSTLPLAVETTLTFQTISAGGSHTCAIATAGTSHCWGGNRRGQLGNGEVFDVPLPQQVLGGLTLQSISTGADHTCGVSVDAEVYCWGDNFRSQIGNGSSAFRFTKPQFIVSIAGLD